MQTGFDALVSFNRGEDLSRLLFVLFAVSRVCYTYTTPTYIDRRHEDLILGPSSELARPVKELILFWNVHALRQTASYREKSERRWAVPTISEQQHYSG